MSTDTPAAPAPAHGRAGRNLPAAVGVGLALGALIIVPLYAQRDFFIPIVVAAIAVGVWELVRALRQIGIFVALPPVVAGGSAMIVLAYLRGTEAMVVGLLLTLIATLVWRALDGGAGLVRDFSSAVFTVVYVPFLASFCALLTAPADGPRRVTIFIATTVCSDIGGYAAGVLAGRHPMAPTISPKKSWEGFGGSTIACLLGGSIMVSTLLHQAWWEGALYGLAVVCTATLGDLGESMIKRDIGIKDMGTLLPGHGGIMDRLDSILLVAPVAWAILSVIAPVPS